MYPRLESYVSPARKYPQLWRLALGLLLVGLIYFAAGFAIFWLLRLTLAPNQLRALAASLQPPTSPQAVLVLFATFPPVILGGALAARWLHRRPARSLLGPPGSLLRPFALAAGTVLALAAPYLAIWLHFFDPVPNLPPALWLKLLPITLLGLAVQTAAEEILFRGYILQQLAARFRSPLIWMVLQAALFGLIHYDPAQPWAINALVMGSAAIFGLIAADLTALSGSIGAAWGFHFANNLMAVGLLALDGAISGLALWRTPYGSETIAQHPWVMVSDTALTVLAWALIRTLLRRRRG